MLMCLHSPAASRRALVPRQAKVAAAPRCGHRVAVAPRCQRRLQRCHAAAPSSQPGAGDDKNPEAENEQQQEEVPAASGAELSAFDRAKALIGEDELNKEELLATLNELAGDLAFYRERFEASEEQRQSLEGTLTTTKDQFMRLTADFENFRRRTAEEKQRISAGVKGDVVLELLPLVDNFELARTQVKAETEAEQKINNSYQGLYKQMVEILKSLGVEPVDTVGSLFDPEKHEAIMRQPNEEVPDGTVLMEFRKGFAMGERLLRPAMVQVSFQEGGPAPSSSSEE